MSEQFYTPKRAAVKIRGLERQAGKRGLDYRTKDYPTLGIETRINLACSGLELVKMPKLVKSRGFHYHMDGLTLVAWLNYPNA